MRFRRIAPDWIVPDWIHRWIHDNAYRTRVPKGAGPKEVPLHRCRPGYMVRFTQFAVDNLAEAAY
jgi:hypothetical protein